MKFVEETFFVLLNLVGAIWQAWLLKDSWLCGCMGLVSVGDGTNLTHVKLKDEHPAPFKDEGSVVLEVVIACRVCIRAMPAR